MATRASAQKPEAVKKTAAKKANKKPAKKAAPKKPSFTLSQAREIGTSYKLKIGELVRIDTDFEHYYFLGKVGWVPSLTHLLGEAGPIGIGLRNFWKNNTAEESDQILTRAGDFGTKMHHAFEELLNGLMLDLLHDYPTLTEKKSLMAFDDWFKTYKPASIHSEKVAGSKRYKYGCTLDYFGTIGEKLWVIDFKTSNAIHFNHKLQVIAQRHALQESFGLKAEVQAILRLGTNHTGARPQYVNGMPMSGKGWELCIVDKLSIKDFMGVYNTYLALHDHKIPDPPEVVVYPETLQIIQNVAPTTQLKVKPSVAPEEAVSKANIKSIKKQVSKGRIKS